MSLSTSSAPHRSSASLGASQFNPFISWLLILPLLVTFTLGFIYPVAKLMALSFSTGGETYLRLVEDSLYFSVLLSTVGTAAAVTFLCLALGYPVAYAMARLKGLGALVTAACVFVPLWTSVLIRSYAWIVLLQRNGILNDIMLETGFAERPLKLLYTHGSVILGMTHILLPFAILPIYGNLKTLPADLARAAANLGAGRLDTFLRVTLPLSMPGIYAGAILCFVLALGFYITPALLGGPGSLLMATLIGQQTTVVLDWPFAAALSTTLLCVTLLVVLICRRAFSLTKGSTYVH
ncbi:ABC transporter permease [Rhizobium sp. RU36D]|uniref:ABC transporter permease n=1 Tax=Rhizobium sp. RU36D TaxID=1907415 RepID=UPI0009D7EA41|nr:ABC transporter permease [Rhizobium sp. RU36D]SMD20139.1 mannopine transport system permease protein [Rhizobium sp. RU36D]